MASDGDDLDEYELACSQTGMPAGSTGHAPDPERELLGAFLMECDRAGISVALFVDASRPGIFTREQVSILCNVRVGILPLNALGELAPGRKHALLANQIVSAQALMFDRAGLLFVEVYRLILENQV